MQYNRLSVNRNELKYAIDITQASQLCTTLGMAYEFAYDGLVVSGADMSDGFVGRLHLKSGKRYRFSAETDGIYGNEIYGYLIPFELDEYYIHMSSGDEDFIPEKDGEYYFRLIIADGGIYHFKRISIREVIENDQITPGGTFGDLPELPEGCEGWYTAPENGEQIDEEKPVSTEQDVTEMVLYAA